jgi:hypothetical protein
MAFVWIVVMPVVASAQASITGVVRDTSGAVLPGVTVEAASPALIERVRAAVTDGTGQYRIENLRPGTFTVTFTLAGFAVVRREGIELTGTFTATVNAELRVGALEETITVTGETPVVDVQSSTRQRVMDREILDTIPSGRAEFNLAVLIPGVTVSSGGGHDVGGAGGQLAYPALQIHGSGSGDQANAMNGVNTAIFAASGGYSVIRINYAATQELTVDTAAVDAEFAVGGVRMNRIPRDGGNTFNGTVFGSFANSAMQGNNLTQELRDRGLRTPDSINKNWEINPGFGGPIVRDRLWFYGAYQHRKASLYAAGLFFNRNVNNPNAWTYEPDFSRPVTNERHQKDGQIRLTWQATQRNKIGFTWQEVDACYCPQRASLISALESETERAYPDNRVVLADWTVPVTSRLLLELGAAVPYNRSNRFRRPFLNPGLIPVTEQSTGMAYRAGDPYSSRWEHVLSSRGAVSYITGAHAVKLGITHRRGGSDYGTWDEQPLSFRLNRGVPNQLTQRAYPFFVRTNLDHELGLFAQDRWTTRGLTFTYGVRYDYFESSFPDLHVGPAVLVPTRNITFPPLKGVAYHDVTPRLGAAYDPFGTGKTAVKVSLNKYLVGLGENSINLIHPINNLVVLTTRAWNDVSRDFAPDCDLLNPLANGECGPMANADFGKVSLRGGGERGRGIATTYDPDLLRGWGRRGYNWEFSAGVQQELLPRIAAEVSYFRRWFGNQSATENRATTAADFDPFSITAPRDPRLPGGGGYVISGLYDLKPQKFGVPVDNLVTRVQNYGTLIEYWHGVDLSLSARPQPGVLVQGGFSLGRSVRDDCEIKPKLDNPSTLYCRVVTPFLTQAKFIGAYTIPRVDVQVSTAFQSLPGSEIRANYVASNAEVSRSLGRNLAGGARNVTVNLVEPGTLYGERLNQLDLRIAKILRLGRTRASLNVDIFNVLNGNAALAENPNYGRFRQPTEILLARFAKVGVQLDF